jgi:hypothetical protein
MGWSTKSASSVRGSNGSAAPSSGSAGAAVRINVHVPDLQHGRASSYTVASYVRAFLRVRALRRELGSALLEAERCKKALMGRLQASALQAEAQALLAEFEAEEQSCRIRG